MSGFPAPGGAVATSPPDTAPASTFGDKRPHDPGHQIAKDDWPPLPGKQTERKLNEGCTFPDIQTYRQTNGDQFLTRFTYNGLWVTGVGLSEPHAVYLAQQFYMNETRNGRADSVAVVQGGDE